MSMLLSIEFDSHRIKMLEASMKNDELIISNYAYIRVDRGIEDGDITDEDYIAKLIKDEINKNNFKANKAVFIINTSNIITRKIKLPILKDRLEVFTLLQNELEQILSIDLSNYKINYKISEEKTNNKNTYFVYCIPKYIIEKYIIISKKTNLKLISIDTSFNCLNKILEHKIMLNNSLVNSQLSTGFLKLSKDCISFCVLNNGINEFSKISNLFQNTMEYNLDLIDRVSEDISEYSHHNKNHVDEINKLTKYYSMNDNNDVNKIYVYGTSKDEKETLEYINKNLNIDIELIENISKCSFQSKETYNKINLNEYIVLALSLFIKKENSNFISDILTDRSSKIKYKALLFSTIALFFISFVYLYNYNKTIQLETTKMKYFITEIENIKRHEQVEQIKKEILRLESKNNESILLEEIISNDNIISSQLLRTFYEAKPINTKILSLSIDRNTLHLQCYSDEVIDITLFLKNLRNVHYISDIYIPSILKNQNLQQQTYSYSIVCKIKDVNNVGN